MVENYGYYTNVACNYDKILLRYVDDKGVRHMDKISIVPHLYVLSNDDNDTTTKDIHGNPLKQLAVKDIADARQRVKQYKDVQGFEIYGMQRYEYQAIRFLECLTLQGSVSAIRKIPSIKDHRVCNMDIEVKSDDGFPDPEEAEKPVTAITLDFLDEIVVFGHDEYKTMPDGFETDRKNITYIKCDNERDLLQKFIQYWAADYPDIVTGWNVRFFDIPYLVKRISNLFGREESTKLSPWKIINYSVVDLGMNRKALACELVGVSTLDYMDLYQRYAPSGKSQPSYKLDDIGNVELGMKKLDYTEAQSLHGLYKTNFQKYIDYNIRDTEIIRGLENKHKLIELAIILAHDSNCNYNDVFTQVRMWDVLIYNYLASRDIAIPPVYRSEKNDRYEGAHVKEPKPGMYNYVASFDLDSLYPHLIMQYNISPETLLEMPDWNENLLDISAKGVTVNKLLDRKIDLSKLKENMVGLTPNGQFFDNSVIGFLNSMMFRMYEDRKTYKTLMISCQQKLEEARNSRDRDEIRDLENSVARYKNLQMAKKVCLNSAYGALGNQYFRFYDIRMALAITKSGQLSIRWVERDVNAALNKFMGTDKFDYVIAADTDSLYINLEPIMNKFNPNKKIKFMDEFCNKFIQPAIEKSYRELASYVNAYENKMHMKREALADRALWTAKKRYIMNVWDQEGVRYSEPKLKISGLEAIKSSTPKACRDKIKEAIKIIITKDNPTLITFINQFKDEFKKLPEDEIAFPRGINGLRKYADETSIFSKGTPIHVRGALIYNRELSDRGLDKDWETIKEGEKVKYIFLKEPNPMRSNVLSFSTLIPPELDVHKYIDYDMQFQKSFIDPLQIILDCIGWQTEKKATLFG